MDAALMFFNDLEYIIGNSIWCDLVEHKINDYTWDDGKFTGREKSENVVKKWGGLFC